MSMLRTSNSYRYILLLCMIICAATSHLQAQAQAIYARAFHAGDSVMLRWIPSDYANWQYGNTSGYKITRYGLDEYFDMNASNASGKGVIITDKILPSPKNDSIWSRLQKSIPSSAFVFSGLYQKSKPVSDPKRKAQNENLSFGFAMKICDDEPSVAKAAGLFYCDKTARKGEQYIYKIEFASTRAGQTKTSEAVVTADEKTSILKSVPKPSVQFRNRKMRLIFDVSVTHESYSGYIIERSEDGKSFTRINKQLVSFTRSQYETTKKELTFEDSLPANEKVYWYRVKGFSYFGMEGPASETVNGSGREDWLCYPIADTAFTDNNKRVTINWTWPYTDNSAWSKDLQSVVLLRAEKVNGTYSYVTGSNTVKQQNTFIDTAASFTNYYQLIAISANKDSAASFPFLVQLQDNTPPASPENLIGSIDTNGRVSLRWNPVADQSLKGYRVFRCNASKEEFVEITDSVISTTTFIDSVTLNTLTKDVFYAVKAVDHVWNNSELSKPARLKRPDRIAPVKPVMRSIYHSDSTITLAWHSSSSADVEGHVLSRIENGKATELLRWTVSDTHSIFVDTTAIPGNTYSYEIAAFDSAGNQSSLHFPEYRFATRIRKPLQNFTATADLEKKIITLKWDLPAQPVDRFIIYKSKQSEQLRSFKTLNGTTNTFTDTQLNPGNTYVYSIRAVMQDGGETRLVSVVVTY